jgi:2,3-bisphosphoglycerate-independent phosphoglycerate mutase
MVGHTGELDAAIRAIEAVDAGVGAIAAAVRARGGALVVTADHGLCEQMKDEQGHPRTAHTTSPVPLWLTGESGGVELAPGRLCDVAPTLLDLMGLAKPEAMTGRSLLVRR